ncbi:hypothetical protein GCM10010954_25600 [Halobacillus andaensis]|uniref:DUF2512 family protein n=1 Tax=Halobacillus andaensis TaxID=1176239 RepID=A0A917B5T7_HALAA|nr:hypothetical protein [Halobacillus andaensis]MBP2005852.1 cation transport ATPase [Halobacillus andaensis]GGF25572.1 hypothetical protein GCM10010954_25600 [Halobacillus andaensis]
MTSLLVKVFALPSLLVLAMYFLDSVQYGAIWQPLLVAFVLIVVGVPMEKKWVREGNLWASVLMDVISAFFIIWGLSNMFGTAAVTFTGAFILSIIIGFCEYFLHKHILKIDEPKAAME